MSINGAPLRGLIRRITGRFAPLIGKSYCKYIIISLLNRSAMVITAAQVTITSRLTGLHRWIGILKLPGLKMTIGLVGGTKCMKSNVLKVNTVRMYLTVLTIIFRKFRLSHVRRCNRWNSRIYFHLLILLWRSGCCFSWLSRS